MVRFLLIGLMLVCGQLSYARSETQEELLSGVLSSQASLIQNLLREQPEPMKLVRSIVSRSIVPTVIPGDLFYDTRSDDLSSNPFSPNIDPLDEDLF